MINLFLMEFYKLKRSWMFICAITGTFVSPVMSTLVYYTWAKEGADRKFLFSDVFARNHMFSILLINILLFSLIATYVINREYMENTIASILTIPVSRFSYLTGKLMIVLFSMFFLTGLSYLFVLLIGFIFQAEGLTTEILTTALVYYFKGALLMTPCIITGVLAACISKNYIVPIVFSIIAVIGNIFLSYHDTYSYFYPWLIPTLLSAVEWNRNPDLVNYSVMISVGFTLITTLATYLYFCLTDIE